MEQGWVYVLVNSSMPGIIKVGRTTRPPGERAAELSAATGVATPFVLAFEQSFTDCVRAEQDIHAELDRRHLRVAMNREFFRGSPADIVRLVLDVAALSGEAPELTPSPNAAAWLEKGDDALFGRGETLQDMTEALRCYRLAVTRGSLVALERLGAIYAQLPGKGRTGRRRAVRYLRDGAKRGNYYCYTELARAYAAERHAANFTKVWKSFFQQRETQYRPEVEIDEARYIAALRIYLCGCIDLDLEPVHMAELKAAAVPLLQTLLVALDKLHDAPEARMRLVGALRWTYENLLPPPPYRKLPQRWRMPAWVARALAA
jgi:hypothetical protein